MEVRLDGRTAIITGGSKGLGLAMAKEFAASGANVAILARSADSLTEAKAYASAGASGKVETFQCDVSKADEINKTFDAVIKTFGKVDILINNAGISRAMPSTQITDEIWQDDLDLKLFAAIRLTRKVWPGMQERKWGRIINVLNTGAKAPRANGAPTAVSRAAGMALMKVLSGEGAPHGILVNGMLVGLIDSDQHKRRHEAAARSGSNESYEAFRAKLGANVPLGRVGKAEEFAAMACFLCSDHAGFTTGTAINMDGGASPVV
jgi:3-oxoacyl-[acyl-carrier protein] reductase